MNNKRLIALTICCILIVIPGICVLSFADNESGANTGAQQHFEKANELRKVADHNAAITEYEKVISLSPKSKIAQDAQYWVGQSYFETRQFDAALSAFQKLLDEYPASTIIPSTKLMIERVEQAKKNKPLFEAVKKGDIEQVKKLIADGADVNATEDLGQVRWTPLIAAASGGNAQVVKVLLENRAKVDATDSHGYTPLYYALWTDGNDSEEIVRALIASGADVNKRSPGDKTYPPLVFAIWIWEGREGNVKALLDAGADIDVKDDNGLTPLYWAAFNSSKDVLDLILARGNYANTIHLAACRGDLSRVKTLIEEGTDVNTRDKFGCTPLHWVALADTNDVGDFLIVKGADANARDDMSFTPLMVARRLGMIEFLISKGADVNAKVKTHGRTRLHMSCYAGERAAAELLIAKGANVDAKDNGGVTPLRLAAASGHKDIVELLLEKGADVNVTDNQGRTPLAVAKQHKHTEVVNILRQHGAIETLLGAAASGDIDAVKLFLSKGDDINIRGNNGDTPLLIAARNGHEDLVKLLIEKGANINASNNRGRTPLAVAKQGKHAEVINILRQHGAVETLHGAAASGDIDEVKRLLSEGQDVNSRDSEGQTPLHLAVKSGDREMVKFLLTRDADVRAEDKDRSTPTPIGRAVRRQKKEIVEILLGGGADIQNLGAALHLLAWNGQIEMLDFMISRGANIEAKSIYQTTPLREAVYNKQYKTVEFLISKGADVHASSRYSGGPIFTAVERNDKEMIELLIANGADIKAVLSGETALHWAMARNLPEMTRFLLTKGCETSPVNLAAFYGELDRVKKLVAEGADVNAKDNGSYSPLHCAVRGEHKDVVEFLISQGAHVNAKTSRGWTPLMGAQSTDIVRLLLVNNASVNMSTETGETALHVAVNRGNTEAVKLLLDHRANVNAKCPSTHGGWEGFTPFHVACGNGNLDIVGLLLAHVADVNAKSDKGDTPLSLARKNKHAEVVELLLKHGAKE
jgi:ankyrin repeat protein